MSKESLCNFYEVSQDNEYFKAIANGRLNELREILRQNPKAAELSTFYKDKFGHVCGINGLHWAVIYDKLEIAKFLLENTSINKNALSGSMKTPIMIAAAAGNVNMVKLLLDNRAEVQISKPVLADYEGVVATVYSALNEAVYHNEYKVVALILREQRNSNLNLGSRYNALHIAVKNNHPLVIIELLKHLDLNKIVGEVSNWVHEIMPRLAGIINTDKFNKAFRNMVLAYKTDDLHKMRPVTEKELYYSLVSQPTLKICSQDDFGQPNNLQAGQCMLIMYGYCIFLLSFDPSQDLYANMRCGQQVLDKTAQNNKEAVPMKLDTKCVESCWVKSL